MRSKEICWHCFMAEYAHYCHSKREFAYYEMTFNQEWERGKVHCRLYPEENGAVLYIRSIHEVLPDTCPYIVEHTVSQC